MVKIDALIFGYRRLKINPDDLSTLSGILIRASVSSRINNDGTVTVRERDFEKTLDLLSGRIEFSYSDPLGLYGWWKRIPHKYSLILSILICAVVLMLLSNMVWDIRIEGNEKTTDSEIVIGLSECGFDIGDLWQLADLSKIEVAFLDKSENVSWININRRGSVAYVKVIEREEADKIKEQTNSPSNLVATTDCVIEEITVRRGTAVVKPGDTVKAGDLLVIGIIPIESGGGWCAADATVIGRIYNNVTASVDREYNKRIASDKRLNSCSVNIFNFSINIFKRYRNFNNECDIIENEIKCSLFNKCKLPISIRLEYLTESRYENATYTDEELVNIAFRRLTSLLALRLCNADLLKMQTDGGFSDTGYSISTDIVYLDDVAERVKLEIIK